MTKFVTAYFYNAFEGEISAFALSAENAGAVIKERINSGLFDIARVEPGFDIYLDDEGLTAGLATIAEFKGWPAHLAGNLVFVWRDELGNLVEPELSIEEVAERLLVKRPVLDPQLDFIASSIGFGTTLTGFKIRVEQTNAVVVADGEA